MHGCSKCSWAAGQLYSSPASPFGGVLNLQLFSRQNHNLASISPLNLLHVSADLTLVECYMDWFLWIHALMLLKLAVKCCDGWGTSCASTKIGLGNITQWHKRSPNFRISIELFKLLLPWKKQPYWTSGSAMKEAFIEFLNRHIVYSKRKKWFASVQFSMFLIIHVRSISRHTFAGKKNLLVWCVHCWVILKPIHKIIQMGFSVHKMIHQFKTSVGY